MSRLLALASMPIAFVAWPGATLAAEVEERPRVAIVHVLREEGGGLGYWIEQTVVFQRVLGGSKPEWIAERRRTARFLGSTTFHHQWLSSRGCPVIEQVLAEIKSLSPEPAGYLTMDASTVTLVGPVGDERAPIVARGGTIGPVAKWWREHEKKLEGCWGGRSKWAAVLLSTDEAAVALFKARSMQSARD